MQSNKKYNTVAHSIIVNSYYATDAQFHKNLY